MGKTLRWLVIIASSLSRLYKSIRYFLVILDFYLRICINCNAVICDEKRHKKLTCSILAHVATFTRMCWHANIFGMIILMCIRLEYSLFFDICDWFDSNVQACFIFVQIYKRVIFLLKLHCYLIKRFILDVWCHQNQ